jgi:putative thioredoxin
MTQQPFSRPGAIDLSALKRPAGSPAPGAGRPAGGAPAGYGAGPGAGTAGGVGGAAGAAGASAYALDVTEQNFQATVEASMTAPVLLVFYSPSRMPESATLADDVATLADEFEGRFLAGLVDIDTAPGIAQAMQIPSIPLVVAVLDGRPAPLLQDALPLDQLREQLTQVFQQLTVNGITGRHQPRHAVVADLDMLGGHVDDAFNRLIELVRRTSGDERDRAREHLIGLFGAVGNDDPRVLRGRQNLASALF